MSTLEDLDDLEREGKENRKDDDKDKKEKKPDQNGNQNGDAEMKDPEKKEEEEEEDDPLDSEILHSSTREITSRRKLLENDMRIMKSEYNRLQHEKTAMNEKIKDNIDKIDNNR